MPAAVKLSQSLPVELPPHPRRSRPFDLRAAATTLSRATFTALSAAHQLFRSLLVRLHPYARRLGRIDPRIATTAILFCLAFATIVILARSPATTPAETGATAGRDNAVIPQAPQTEQTPQTEPAPPTRLAGSDIRIIDRPTHMESDCKAQKWPYLAQRCLSAAKNEKDKNGAAAGKSGPSANKQDQNIPIGSMTAITPARPAVSATEGVAQRELNELAVEPNPVVASRKLASKSDGRAKTSAEPAPAERASTSVEQNKPVRRQRVAKRRNRDESRHQASMGRERDQTASSAQRLTIGSNARLAQQPYRHPFFPFFIFGPPRQY